MCKRIQWDDGAAHHIRTRSQRYPEGIDIEPAWTREAVDDPDRIVDEPDPQSAHANSVRLVGYSPSAWRTTGKPRRQYWEGRSDD